MKFVSRLKWDVGGEMVRWGDMGCWDEIGRLGGTGFGSEICRRLTTLSGMNRPPFKKTSKRYSLSRKIWSHHPRESLQSIIPMTNIHIYLGLGRRKLLDRVLSISRWLSSSLSYGKILLPFIISS